MDKYVVVVKFTLRKETGYNKVYKIICSSWSAWRKFRKAHVIIDITYARKVILNKEHLADCDCF